MCLLTFYPDEIQPDLGALYVGAEWNPDGHGYAIVTDQGLRIGKGMNADEMVERFAKERAAHPYGPALFHSRLGTGGTTNRYNCHPFHFGGDRRTVVAHNGVLPALVQPTDKDKRCDTRIAAQELFPSGFGHLSDRLNRDRVASWIGPHNKLVILTVNPEYNRNHYIINEKSGVWDSGIWYSNQDYLLFAPEDVPDECPWCETAPFHLVGDRCNVCNRCVDCGEDWYSRCDCYAYDPENRDELDRWDEFEAVR